MDYHKIEKARAVGFSMGAKTIMYAACTEPERFEKVLIIETAPVSFGNLPELGLYLEFMKELNLKGKTKKQLEKEIKLRFTDPSQRHVPALMLSLMKLEEPNHYS